MLDQEIDRRFGFHPATDVTGPMHDKVRADCAALARSIVDLTPRSREQSLAITALEEAMMWANAAIARPHCDKCAPAPVGHPAHRTGRSDGL